MILSTDKPIYDTSILGIGNSGWSCQDWIDWHKAMVSDLGQSAADSTWSNAWVAGVSTSGGGLGTAPGSGVVFDSVPIDCRTFNSEFRDYINNNSTLKAAVFSGILGSTVGAAESTVVGGITSAETGISNLFGAGVNVTKVLKWLIPAIIIIVVVLAIFFIIKKVKVA